MCQGALSDVLNCAGAAEEWYSDTSHGMCSSREGRHFPLQRKLITTLTGLVVENHQNASIMLQMAATDTLFAEGVRGCGTGEMQV